jgi:hypothetical protein
MSGVVHKNLEIMPLLEKLNFGLIDRNQRSPIGGVIGSICRFLVARS